MNKKHVLFRIFLGAILVSSILPDCSSAFSMQIGKPRLVYRQIQEPVRMKDSLTIDVFWCTGDDWGYTRSLKAAELAASYGVAAKLIQEMNPTSDRAAGEDENALASVAEIRTRPIEKETFLKAFDTEQVSAAERQPLVRYDRKDGRSVRVVMLLEKAVARPMMTVDTAESVPNYVSIYLCDNVDTASYDGRLFFQVGDSAQKKRAIAATKALREQVPGLSVASGIEVVGDKAPQSSELRYFFDADAGMAASVAAHLSTATETTFRTRKIDGFEGKIKPGTLEAWLAKNPDSVVSKGIDYTKQVPDSAVACPRYSTSQGCNSLSRCVDTMNILLSFRGAPEEVQQALDRHITSSKWNCRCVRALVGPTNFPTLLKALNHQSDEWVFGCS